LPANIRKRQKGLTVANTLAFYIAEFIVSVKGFIEQAEGFEEISGHCDLHKNHHLNLEGSLKELVQN
jgi:hypothetical protein